MASSKRHAVLALAAAGALWGLTVPLSKLALGWLSPQWLTLARFVIAAPPLAWLGRRGLRAALRPSVTASGAIGFGAVIMLQNAGLARTSVSHAAVILGVVPILVALIAAGGRREHTGPAGWAGYGLALLGIALIAGRGGGGATATGDGLVLGSAVLSALFISLQPRILTGRDAAAVTAVQFAAGAALALPFALLGIGGDGGAASGSGRRLHLVTVPPSAAPVLALVALALLGTLLPFWLFARGQARVPAQLAGAFVNLEPLVGAVVGWAAFGDAAGALQLLGGAAVLLGVALSAMPAGTLAPRRVALALASRTGG